MTVPPLIEDEDMLPQLSELAPLSDNPAMNDNIPRLAENKPVDDPPTSLRFQWKIENFCRPNVKKQYSDIFTSGGSKWRILVSPKGDLVDSLSMFLDVADAEILPNGWNMFAKFILSIVNQIDGKNSVTKEFQHQFNARMRDWGSRSFVLLSELCDPSKGYLVNDALIVEAEISSLSTVNCLVHDSRKETGYVGLENQGATCYMNSLLQTMYHIPYFRKAVYHMPTSEYDMPSTSFPRALQSLFCKLQFSNTSVATKELTLSFGWVNHEAFLQCDVQEFNRVFCENLENKMKSTVVDGTMQKLFRGHHMNIIECINVNHKSERKESFYDLQLDVKGCRDVYASFDKYVEVERLEGDNKYNAGQYGLQDAEKRVLFLDFPPVLQLHLKRFEYDSTRNTMLKVNDRYEFPLQLDLDREDGKYLSPADRSVRNLYSLHSVLVHSGGGHEGHYYAFIRPTLSDQWYKFDDERVTKEDIKMALEEQYGGEQQERLKKEQDEKEYSEKEKAEAHLYTVVKISRDEDFKEQIGRDLYFDLVDHQKVQSFRVQKQMPFNFFKEEVAKEFGVPVQFQRFWFWAKRRNHTYRVDRPLNPMEEAQLVGQIREVSSKTSNRELNLFLEVEVSSDLHPISPPDETSEDIMLFFKNYDPEKEELRYVGRLTVKSMSKPFEILSKLNEMAGYSPDQEIELYEEVTFKPTVMCQSIDKEASFRANELVDGDIIFFQMAVPTPSDFCDQFRHADVASFLEYVQNRLVVHFHSLEKPKEENFSLEMSKLHTYDDIVEKVAQFSGLNDPSKIRLTSHDNATLQPKPHPIKYRGVDHLSEMLVHRNQTSAILYYEVLDIPLPELQRMKTLKVAFRDASKDEMVLHTITLPRQSTVGDVLNDLRTKVEFLKPRAELRMFETLFHKIYKVFSLDENIDNIKDERSSLHAEEIPEEEKSIGPWDRLIHVYHFTRDTPQNQVVKHFGEPFLLVMHEKETLAEIKVRIQKRLHVPDEDFAKWKFAVLTFGRIEYLEDSDVVSANFRGIEVYSAWEQYLGLDHANTAPERGNMTNQSILEKPMKIYG